MAGGTMYKYKPRSRPSKPSAKQSKFLKRVSKTNRSMTLFRPIGIPDTYRCKLRYTQNVGVTTATAIGNQIFRLNSLQDPDLTGGGHQPTFYDQLTALYKTYRVDSAKITINAVPKPDNTDAVRSTIVANSTTAAFGNINDPAQQKRSKELQLVPGSRPGIMSMYVKNHAVLGVPLQKYKSEDDYSAPTGTGFPALQSLLHITQINASSVISQTVFYTVKIEYYCTFYDRKSQGVS